MRSDLLSQDRVRKITRHCSFCTRKYKRTCRFFGLCKLPPFTRALFLDGLKFRTVLEKGNPRDISMKLFQNLKISFRKEEYLRIPSCWYSTSSLHSPDPGFLMEQNSAHTS